MGVGVCGGPPRRASASGAALQQSLPARLWLRPQRTHTLAARAPTWAAAVSHFRLVGVPVEGGAPTLAASTEAGNGTLLTATRVCEGPLLACPSCVCLVSLAKAAK